MARIKRAVNGHKKRRKALKLAKGFYASRSRQYRSAKLAVMRAQRRAYFGRRVRKREFRQLWIARINAAARKNGLSYSKFVSGLRLAGVEVNRKLLADLAVNDANSFSRLVDMAREKLA